MQSARTIITAALIAAFSTLASAQAVVGVSWSNFQEERWKTDEAAIKAELAKLGASYVSADAGGSPEKQIADVDGLIAKGAKVLIILAMDKDAIVPALAKAKAQEHPGRRLRPPDRAARRVLHHLRQQGSRPHAGARRVHGQAQGQLRHDQGLAHRPERRLPARGPAGGAGRRDQEGRHQDRRRGVHRRLEARESRRRTWSRS